ELIFTCKGDEGGGESFLTRLGEKVPQEALPQSERDAISRELNTPVQAQSLLETLDPAITILASLGGNLVRSLPEETTQMQLADFFRDVLRVGGGSGGDGRSGGQSGGDILDGGVVLPQAV
ncbi:unnamed protein product, partial [Discosporangium mesarthrocarpum]